VSAVLSFEFEENVLEFLYSQVKGMNDSDQWQSHHGQYRNEK